MELKSLITKNFKKLKIVLGQFQTTIICKNKKQWKNSSDEITTKDDGNVDAEWKYRTITYIFPDTISNLSIPEYNKTYLKLTKLINLNFI